MQIFRLATLLALTTAAATAVAQNKPTPQPGSACTTPGATDKTSSGARVDCVSVGLGTQWQLRGSRPNPFAWGEAVVLRTEYETWRVTVDSVDPDVTARVLAVDNKKQPRPGAKLVGLMVTLNYIGKNADSMVRNGVELEAVAASSKAAVERWVTDELTTDDCWTDEFVAQNATKKCMIPFELMPADLPSLLFRANKVVGTAIVYFSGTATRPR